MLLTDSQHEAAHRLWDELADFPASQIDAALACLMQKFSRWLRVDDVVWVGAARISHGATARRDPQEAGAAWPSAI